MATPPSEGQQLFDIDADDARGASDGRAERDSKDESDAARGLVARVEAVHAVAARRATRRARPSDEAWINALFAPETSITGGNSAVADPAVEQSEGAAEAAELSLPAEEFEGTEEPEESLSVAQFYRRIRRALEGEFSEDVWVTGEIRGLRVRGGHRYIELADHGSESTGRAAEQLEVTCWARDWPPVSLALEAAGIELEVGRVVRVRGRVSVWEGGGRLRFTLTALDVEALLGSIAAARHQLLRALEAEGLLDANRRVPVPLVPLRIGLVTSPASEAHHDFVGQLDRSGFAFEVRLEGSLVQGADAPAQLALALRRLESFAPDLAVIVRGGGARGDLAAFDSEEVARAIATAPFPVWCGVGHTGDRSVADEVANFSTITPTACGEAVVARVGQYYEELRRRVGTLASLAARLDTAGSRLNARAGTLVASAHRQLDHCARQVVTAEVALSSASARRLGAESEALLGRARHLSTGATRRLMTDLGDLERCRQVLSAYDPERQLLRGWSLTHGANGRLVRSIGDLSAGEELTTRLADGELRSVLTERRAHQTSETDDRAAGLAQDQIEPNQDEES